MPLLEPMRAFSGRMRNYYSGFRYAYIRLNGARLPVHGGPDAVPVSVVWNAPYIYSGTATSAARAGRSYENGRSSGARTRISIAYRRTTGDHEELRVSRSGFPTIRSPVDGSCDIWVTAYRKLGYQIGRCQITGKPSDSYISGPSQERTC